MNRGYFNHKNEYVKRVRFSQAVLWKDRQLSIPPEIMLQIRFRKCSKLIFIDEVKGEKWEFNVDNVLKHAEKKKVGQEKQFYFPISLAKIIPLNPLPPRPIDNTPNQLTLTI